MTECISLDQRFLENADTLLLHYEIQIAYKFTYNEAVNIIQTTEYLSVLQTNLESGLYLPPEANWKYVQSCTSSLGRMTVRLGPIFGLNSNPPFNVYPEKLGREGGRIFL